MDVQYRGEEQFRESPDSVHLSTEVSEKGNLEDWMGHGFSRDF